MAEGGAVSEICDSNRLSGKKKNNNKDSTEIRKTIKDSNVLESFNETSLSKKCMSAIVKKGKQH